MTINDEQDEGLFFECWLDSTPSNDGGNAYANAKPCVNLRPTVKRSLIVCVKHLAEQERGIFRQIKEEISKM